MLHGTSSGGVHIHNSLESWDHTEARDASGTNSLRPIGAEHKASASGAGNGTGKTISRSSSKSASGRRTVMQKHRHTIASLRRCVTRAERQGDQRPSD